MQQTDYRQACINVSFKAGHGGSDDVTTCFEAAKVSGKQVKRVLQAMNPVVYVCNSDATRSYTKVFSWSSKFFTTSTTWAVSPMCTLGFIRLTQCSFYSFNHT